jgi:hypothetical protein
MLWLALMPLTWALGGLFVILCLTQAAFSQERASDTRDYFAASSLAARV